MNQNRNNPSWCYDKIEELIEQYKHKLYTLDKYGLDLSAKIAVSNELESVIYDLATILYD